MPQIRATLLVVAIVATAFYVFIAGVVLNCYIPTAVWAAYGAAYFCEMPKIRATLLVVAVATTASYVFIAGVVLTFCIIFVATVGLGTDGR